MQKRETTENMKKRLRVRERIERRGPTRVPEDKREKE